MNMSQKKLDYYFAPNSKTESGVHCNIETTCSDANAGKSVNKLSASYPDPAKVSCRSDDSLKVMLMENNREWTKTFTFPSKIEYGTKRQFSSDWLDKYAWLRYSVSEDSVYCAPCLLFGSRNADAKEITLITTPVSSWSNLGKYINRHLKAEFSHHSSCATAESFLRIMKGEQMGVMSQLSKSHSDTVSRNRHVLRVVLEVIVLCGHQNIPLRSHNDEDSNFMALLNDRADRDSVLKTHLESNLKAKYTSPKIQNELISLCEEAIKGGIVQKCNEAKCYSFLADEATDASTMEQIAMCVRYYVQSENDVREDFIGFIQAESTTGEALFTKFIEGQRNVGLNITKMRGQGYDGASNMAGCHRGVQARIKALVPQAMYVHCKAHSLNLAIVHACKQALVRNMFDTVQQIAFAFNYSAKRLLAFKHELQNDLVAREEMEKRTRLQNLCETRWASRADSLLTFKSAFSTIVSSLEALEHEGDSKARSYRCSILKFDFIVSLVVVEFVLHGVMPLNKMLQSKSGDLVEASKESNVLITQIRAERADDDVWMELYQKAVAIAEAHGVKPSKPRTARHQQHRGNVPAESISEYWKRALYFAFLDHLVVELEDRLLTAHDRFLAQYLIPSMVHQLTGHQEESIFNAFNTDLTGGRENFRREVTRWKVRWSIEEDKPSDPKSALSVANADLYPDIHTCLVVLITMPVSTASAERSFSVMRRVKNYLRSTMTTERLSGLAMLHSYRHEPIDLEDIITKFAGKKTRRLDFV